MQDKTGRKRKKIFIGKKHGSVLNMSCLMLLYNVMEVNEILDFSTKIDVCIVYGPIKYLTLIDHRVSYYTYSALTMRYSVSFSIIDCCCSSDCSF